MIRLGLLLEPRRLGVAVVGQGAGQGVEAPDGGGVRGHPVPVVLDVLQSAGGQESVLDRPAAVGPLGHRGLTLANYPVARLDQVGGRALHPRLVAGEPPVLGHAPHHVAVVLVVAHVLVAGAPVEQAVGST